MINSLYKTFQHWSMQGSIYIMSDPHFEDSDCKLMDLNWLSPEEHIRKLKTKVHKNDTLICLGDVGKAEWMNELKCYKVLVKGNHDGGSANYLKQDTGFKTIGYFDEVYEGPLFISSKILLSHEPIIGDYWLNIHGHDHAGKPSGPNCLNVASNVINYDVISLGDIIKKGLLSNIDSIHRDTINKATERKLNKEA